MKKLLAVGFLSLAMLGVANAPASALGHLRFHCCNKCCSYICCRQYNAFTPVCFGNITCVGCCPIGNCGLQAPGYQGYPGGGACGDPCADGCCSSGSCGEGCGSYVTGALPPATNNKGPSNGNGPSFTPPMPTPVDGNPMPTSMLRQGYPWANRVMPAGGYYPGYGYWPQMPMYNPNAPQPAMNAFSGGN